jgi:hypothetical protein
MKPTDAVIGVWPNPALNRTCAKSRAGPVSLNVGRLIPHEHASGLTWNFKRIDSGSRLTGMRGSYEA